MENLENRQSKSHIGEETLETEKQDTRYLPQGRVALLAGGDRSPGIPRSGGAGYCNPN